MHVISFSLPFINVVLNFDFLLLKMELQRRFGKDDFFRIFSIRERHAASLFVLVRRDENYIRGGVSY